MTKWMIEQSDEYLMHASRASGLARKAFAGTRSNGKPDKPGKNIGGAEYMGPSEIVQMKPMTTDVQREMVKFITNLSTWKNNPNMKYPRNFDFSNMTGYDFNGNGQCDMDDFRFAHRKVGSLNIDNGFSRGTYTFDYTGSDGRIMHHTATVTGRTDTNYFRETETGRIYSIDSSARKHYWN